MIPSKRFDIFSPDGGMLRRSKCVQNFLEKYSKSIDQPVANPARGQLIRENVYFPVSVPA